MSSILLKVFVARFYKINTGFFLALFMLLFGIMAGKAAIEMHYAAMQAIMGSPLFFCIAILLWAMYNVKCISFCLKEISGPANSFLFEIQTIDNKQQFRTLFLCHLAIYSPVLAYSIIAAFVGFSRGSVLLPVSMLLFQSAMCVSGAAICFKRLNNTWNKPAFSLPSFDLFRKKSFLFYLLHYSFYYRKGTFIGVKLFSILLLQIMVAANSDKLSREAICILIMFLVSAHALLPLYYVGFMENEFSFLRNLPLALVRRFTVYVVTYAIVFLPEVLFLLFNERHVLPLQLTISLYAVAVSQLSLYSAILYLKYVNTERYTMIVFVIFFITLLLLASFNLWILFIAEAITAIGLFAGFYNKYEAIVEKSG